MKFKRKEYKNYIEKQIENKDILAKSMNPGNRRAYDSFYNKYLKRLLDIMISLMLIILFSPFYLIIGLLILLDDGLPVFYKAKRGGYMNKEFNIIKFRTMRKDADKIGSGTTALNDYRITKIGKFIRKIKLDEIPNLFNVLLGQMSIVGPRPELLKYTMLYSQAECLIPCVRPGITDFSSIKFASLDELVGEQEVDLAYETKILPVKNKLRIKYALLVSIETDIVIILKTICVVLKKL